jgi:Carboxylesterase type B
MFLICDIGWTSGGTNTPFYYGGGFADAEDVIVVNIFGFPGLPGHPPNLGLLDQRLAVEWAKQNIHGFGGWSNPHYYIWPVPRKCFC